MRSLLWSASLLFSLTWSFHELLALYPRTGQARTGHRYALTSLARPLSHVPSIHPGNSALSSPKVMPFHGAWCLYPSGLGMVRCKMNGRGVAELWIRPPIHSPSLGQPDRRPSIPAGRPASPTASQPSITKGQPASQPARHAASQPSLTKGQPASQAAITKVTHPRRQTPQKAWALTTGPPRTPVTTSFSRGVLPMLCEPWWHSRLRCHLAVACGGSNDTFQSLISNVQ